jgi:anti-sigma factor ChrR (cupin superfamily)
VSGIGEAVYLVRIAAGVEMPLDRTEWVAEILILEGGFCAAGRRYRANDFISLEAQTIGTAAADPVRGCLCLITAADEPLLLTREPDLSGIAFAAAARQSE